MMATANPYERYRQQGVLMANPVELVVMLYDGCIKQLKLARIAINEKKFDNSNNCLQKAQMIIVELLNSLDFHYPIAKELMNIYDFVLTQIIEINISKSESAILSLIEILSSLREAWEQVQKTNKIAVSMMEE